MRAPKEYVHHFAFHLLEGLSAQEWFPRAQARHRWEVEEESKDTHFGYCWAPLSAWGPHLGGQLCSWLKAIFHQKRKDFLAAVEALTGHCLEGSKVQSVRGRAESVERPAVPSARQTGEAQKPPEELPEDLEA